MKWEWHAEKINTTGFFQNKKHAFTTLVKCKDKCNLLIDNRSILVMLEKVSPWTRGTSVLRLANHFKWFHSCFQSVISIKILLETFARLGLFTGQVQASIYDPWTNDSIFPRTFLTPEWTLYFKQSHAPNNLFRGCCFKPFDLFAIVYQTVTT